MMSASRANPPRVIWCPVGARVGAHPVDALEFHISVVFEEKAAGPCPHRVIHIPGEEIVTAIRQAARGADTLLAPAVTRRLIERFARERAVPRVTSRQLEDLTPRELEVLKLVAQGLSNSEIAATLALSAATVKTHVARILMKLDLRDRVQAVVLAYESGLVRIAGREPH